VNQVTQKSFSTVADAAEFLRVPEDQVIAFEKGTKKPSLSNLLALEGLSIVVPQTDQCEFKFIDLFAGIGGFHYALQSLGAECVFASELNKSHKLVTNVDLKN